MLRLQLFYFFSCILKKINVLQVRWFTKAMTKKMTATPQSSPPLGLHAVPMRWLLYICFAMDLLKDIFINLLSDSIWAIGSFLLAKFLFLKKTFLFPYRKQNLQKRCSIVFKATNKKNLFFNSGS